MSLTTWAPSSPPLGIESDHKRRSEIWGLLMALIDMKERAIESDAFRFRMVGDAGTVVVAVTRAAAQLAGGFANNRAGFAAIAGAKHAKGDLQPNGTILIDATDL